MKLITEEIKNKIIQSLSDAEFDYGNIDDEVIDFISNLNVSSSKFVSYHETHYEVVKYLSSTEDTEGTMAYETHAIQGTGGMYELANELTLKFEEKYKDAEIS